eukprot:gene11527-14146_t
MLHNSHFTTEDNDTIQLFVDHPAGARAIKQLCHSVCTDQDAVQKYRDNAIRQLQSGERVEEPPEERLVQHVAQKTEHGEGRAKDVGQKVLQQVAILREHKVLQTDGAAVDEQHDQTDAFLQQRAASVDRAMKADMIDSPEMKSLKEQAQSIGEAKELLDAERDVQQRAEINAKFNTNREQAIEFFDAQKAAVVRAAHSPAKKLDLADSQDSPEAKP